jgi:hypothetical protein
MVLQVLALTDGGRVVRYDVPSDARGLVDNLACFDRDGSVRWRKAPQFNDGGQADFFTKVRLDGDLLIANTWGCWAIWIDPRTGEDVRSEFTK